MFRNLTARNHSNHIIRLIGFAALLALGSSPGRAHAGDVYYNGAKNFSHQTGTYYYEHNQVVGWGGSPYYHFPGYLTYGPYVTSLPANRTLNANWRVGWFGGSPKRDAFAIEVYDTTANKIIARQTVKGGGNPLVGTTNQVDFTYRSLNFRVPAGHAVEFRTYWFGEATVAVNYVHVTW